MEHKYRISKITLFLFTAPLVFIFLPLSLAPFVFFHEMTFDSWLEWLPLYLITFSYLFFVIAIFRFSFWGELFELTNGELRFSDGSVPLKLEHVSKIKLINSVVPTLRAVHFEMKPGHRKLSFRLFPILGFLGGKTVLTFGLIAGGRNLLCKFYQDVCDEHKKYQN